MNEEQKHFFVVQLKELFKQESEKYYRTPWNIESELLSILTDSDIAVIIWDKRKEWGSLEREKKEKMKGLRWDNRRIVELLYLSYQEEINKLTKKLQYILKSRQPDSDDWFNSEDLRRAKETISIQDIIEVTTWIKIHNTYRLIKCPFPDHKDWTASFKVYDKTNSFYCQWCKKGWSQIDFIRYMSWCNLPDAIKNFLNFYKK